MLHGKCPNCGHKIDWLWPFVVMQLAFGVLYFSAKYYLLAKHGWIVDIALMMYLIASVAFGVIRSSKEPDVKADIGVINGSRVHDRKADP